MLSEEIKELRKKRGLTQEQLAEELNVSRQAIAKWESGAGMPDLENLKSLSLYFHVSADYLLGNIVEKDLTLQHKFLVLEISLFVLGIMFGIISQNFPFGFVCALLLPGIAYCIEKIVLEKKYAKEQNSVLQREVVASQLPTNFYGRVLNTDKQSKGNRIKWYATEAALASCLMTLFRIIGSLFDTMELNRMNVFSNESIDIIFSCAITFLMTFIVAFIMNCLIYEYVIKKYNRIGKN